MTNEEILNHLATISVPFGQDTRHQPDAYRRGQFIRGWNDATVRSQSYAEDTLTLLTWRNLGFRFGRHFGSRSEDEIREAWDVLAAHQISTK